ncbi:hypothetical protein, partial [Ralstonia sp. ASV6]|uniref:hypothetical protein n=1 Tax=Ralstonia sp. ASV6 TaxID=2795124 RepID=UPI001E2FB710
RATSAKHVERPANTRTQTTQQATATKHAGHLDPNNDPLLPSTCSQTDDDPNNARHAQNRDMQARPTWRLS